MPELNTLGLATEAKQTELLSTLAAAGITPVSSAQWAPALGPQEPSVSPSFALAVAATGDLAKMSAAPGLGQGAWTFRATSQTFAANTSVAIKSLTTSYRNALSDIYIRGGSVDAVYTIFDGASARFSVEVKAGAVFGPYRFGTPIQSAFSGALNIQADAAVTGVIVSAAGFISK